MWKPMWNIILCGILLVKGKAKRPRTQIAQGFAGFFQGKKFPLVAKNSETPANYKCSPDVARVSRVAVETPSPRKGTETIAFSPLYAV